MSNNLMPRSFYTPLSYLSFWDDFDTTTLNANNVAISEDDKHVYVEAAVPGLNPEDIEISYDKGILWIRGQSEETEDEQNKKYYQKATSSFSYRVAVPGDIDMNTEPEASCDNGMVMITFQKSIKSQPKKISVKASEKNGSQKKTKK